MKDHEARRPAPGTEGSEPDLRNPDSGGMRETEEGAFEIVPEEAAVPEAGPGRGPGAPPDGAEPSADATSLTTGEVLERAAQELRALRVERDRLYDAWLRSTADFDNFRKRTERDRDEQRQYALENLLRQMLPVLDNFERALGSLPPGAPKAFVDGVTLIYKQLRDVLGKQGLAPMESTGEIFDPHLHEAVETEVRTDAEHHEILEEVQKGYRLGPRVLRPAMVKVCVRPDEERAPSTESVAEDPS